MIIPPQFIFLIGALFIPLFKGWLRTAYMLFLPVFAFFNYLKLEEGIYWTYSILNFDLTLVRADPTSLIFLNIFVIATFIAVIYNSHVKGTMEQFSAKVATSSRQYSTGQFFTSSLLAQFMETNGSSNPCRRLFATCFSSRSR